MMQQSTQISEHFTRDEWDCNCCGQYVVKVTLVEMAEKFRNYLCEKYKKDVPLDIHCVCRCKKHNEELTIELCRACGNIVRGGYVYVCPRCGSKNVIHQGAVENSEHCHDNAIDAGAIGITVAELHESARECHKFGGILCGGLGIYPWGIHFDICSFRRW